VFGVSAPESESVLGLWWLPQFQRHEHKEETHTKSVFTCLICLLLSSDRPVSQAKVRLRNPLLDYTLVEKPAILYRIQNPYDRQWYLRTSVFTPLATVDGSLAPITARTHRTFLNGDSNCIPTIAGS
jgi:hypothetical protein